MQLPLAYSSLVLDAKHLALVFDSHDNKLEA
jgi:hypothetical protein